MSGNRKAVSPARPIADDDLKPGFTAAELWQQLYSEVLPPVGEGEKNLAMIREENDWSYDRAKAWVKKLVSEGKLISVGLRRSENGQGTECWKPV